uniref:Rho GTPase activating protein 20 n=1 Tax=Hippocampus comes TaxID=109280 RepID=A0A3Q2Z416_HIPCM
MLVFLYVEGPFTRGVFRRSAGAKACRELRERLDAGTDDGEIARQLLRLLPPENFLLLRHVAAVLYRIQSFAHDNQMNAFNLSVCIAPSMLWATTPGTPEMEGEGAKKVSEPTRLLVRFLIENCAAMLGDDVTSLFSAFSPQGGSSEHGSDASSFQMNDSSYDSLENELNDEPESPCQDQLPLRDKRDKPDSRSCDSVLTLSDCEPDAEGHGPALAALAGGRLPLRKASYDAAMEGEEEEDEFLEKELNGLHLNSERDQNGGRRKSKHAPPPPLRLDASCSSLSSPATSPTGSSLSSLDSAFSQYSTDYGAVPTGDAPLRSPRCSPPQKDPRPGHGAHPNMWLKKDRRLSLKQPQNGHASEDSPPPAGTQTGTPNRRSSSPPSYQQALLQLQHTSPFYKGADKALTVREFRLLHNTSLAGPDAAQPPMGVFYGQSATTLILKRQNSQSLTPPVQSRTLPRRRSEPTCHPSKTATLDRPRPRLRVSDVEPLSPSADRTVKDYFSATGDAAGCARRSQEVALAVAQAKKEWRSRQCSEPRLDDFDQLFFAEESYV